jgi:hypothetical protein
MEQSIGQLASDLLPAAEVLTRLIHWLCIVVGVCLLVTAISFYQAHRFNPKFMPLERPIIIALLGIVLIALPFYKKIFLPVEVKKVVIPAEKTHQYEESYHPDEEHYHSLGIDEPLDPNWGNDYHH